MGRSLYRLEIFKKRFVKSHPRDLKNLFQFIEEQLAVPKNHESKFTVVLDSQLVERVKNNIDEIKPTELEAILDFADERIEICRNSDMAERIIGDLSNNEFFTREEKYTEIEKYILLKLKIG